MQFEEEWTREQQIKQLNAQIQNFQAKNKAIIDDIHKLQNKLNDNCLKVKQLQQKLRKLEE